MKDLDLDDARDEYDEMFQLIIRLWEMQCQTKLVPKE